MSHRGIFLSGARAKELRSSGWTFTLLILVSATLGLLTQTHSAKAAEGTALVKMRVFAAVAVNTISDMLFTDAVSGAAAETVPADTVETSQNASFVITGEPNRAITVTLPQDGQVIMVNSAGSGSDAEIPINQFTSNNPQSIESSGSTELFVGASRETLSPTQLPGDYSSQFIVDVVYQ